MKMARIIRIGKRNWVVGMTWSSFEDIPSKDELKVDAKRLQASWACVRVGESSIQAGFCPPISNTKKPSNLYSLAAMLADSRQQPWIGTFKVAEGLWWYVAVRDGHAILPDGDIIGGEDEILKAREQHSFFNDWNYLEGDIDTLLEFIAEIDAKPTPVRSLEGGLLFNPLIIAGVGLAVVGATGGYFAWDHKVQAEKKVREAAMAKMRAELAANKPPIEKMPSPLLSTPKPNDWLQACATIIRPLPLSQYGWSLAAVSCEKNGANLIWERKDGATIDYKPEGIVSIEGDKIDQSLPFAEINTKNIDDALPLIEAKGVLRAWAQAANYKLTIMMPPPPAPPLPGAAPEIKKDALPPIPQATFGIDMPVSPLNADFSSIPGLRLTTLKMTSSGWHLDGILYGQ